jgi:hypothetical protein
MPITQLSRAEVTALMFDKVQLILTEAQEVEGDHGRIDLKDALRRLKRIAIEARRAAALLETHERTWTAGHCLHCGHPYAAHLDDRPPLEAGQVRAKYPPSEPRCAALKRFFESLEIETYQGVQIVEVG